MSIANISAAFTLATPPRIVVGWGAATDDRLPAEASKLGTRPLVVVGRSLRANGTLDAILGGLRAKGLTPQLFDGVPPEPDIESVEACRAAAEACDSVIAIGGGSVLDVAKGAAALAGSANSVRDYFEGRAAVPETCPRPIIAVPTTSGTGSEVTWVGVYCDKQNRRKASIRGGAMMPAIALLDAQLTVSCPTTITVHSGMDAFVQAVEAFTSIGANPLTDALALQAVQLASYATVAAAAAAPNDRTARESVALGSLMAGIALNTSRLGLVHGLAHPIGALTGAAHGLVCAMLLVSVMRFNREATATKYAQVANLLLAEDVAGLSEIEAADKLIDAIELFLLERFALPGRLSEIGLREGDVEIVARESMSSGSTKANPRTVSFEDAVRVTTSVL